MAKQKKPSVWAIYYENGAIVVHTQNFSHTSHALILSTVGMANVRVKIHNLQGRLPYQKTSSRPIDVRAMVVDAKSMDCISSEDFKI